MTLLRMLAFAPGVATTSPPPRPATLAAVRPARASVPTPVRAPEAATPAPILSHAPPAAAPIEFDGNWPTLVARLKVSGLVKELAQRSELVSVQGDHFRLRAPLKTLIEAGTVDKLKAALGAALGRTVRVTADVGSTTGPTAAGVTAQANAERQRQAEESIYADPFVRELIDNFGAAVDPASIRPRDSNDTGTQR
jgi:DNA polymerase-3 subunit gamma/tau